MKKYTNFRFIILLCGLFAVASMYFYAQAQSSKKYESLVFQDANIKAIFQFLAKEAGVNIVVNPNVQFSVNLDLKNISWQGVVDILLETYDLTMVQDEGYTRVMTLADFRQKQKDVLSYEEEKKTLLPMQTRIFVVKYAKATELSTVLAQAKSSRGTIVVDSRSNALVVTDIPEQFPKMEALLTKLDIETKQVTISAKIILVDQSYLREMGVEWQAGKPASPAGGDANAHDARDGVISSGTGYGVEAWSQTDEVADKLGHFTWGIMTGEYAFQTALSAIVGRNKGNIIDQPDITTLDNKQAEIFSGEDIPLTQLDESGNVITKMFSIGTTLRITPHITVNDRILIDLYVERNAYTPSTGGYSILKRYATTNIILGPGDYAVIGGISTQDKSLGIKGVPILMDLPLIGRLFKYTTEQTSTKDLVIFVKAKIVE
jgi:type IV pilus secretin PilQ/predicted competence protein